MTDSDDTARAAYELSVCLPPAHRLITLANARDVLSKGDPNSGSAWQLRITNAVSATQLRARYANGLTVEAGTVGAAYSMGTHLLSSDVAAWLRADGWNVTFAEGEPNRKRAVQISAQNESAILQEFEALGVDPLALPTPKSGESGIKAQIRGRVRLSRSAFDHAWQRLRDQGAIVDQKGQASA